MMPTTITRITKLSSVLLTSALLVLSSIAAAQLLLVTTNNNNAVYGQPSPPSPQCEPGFTFNRGVCEQPASSFLTCPMGDDPDSESGDYTLEENEEGTLVCNLHTAIIEPAKINEETGERYCDPPFEPRGSLLQDDPECIYRFISETVEPTTVLGCPNGGDLNTETNTCQMRPRRSE